MCCGGESGKADFGLKWKRTPRPHVVDDDT